MHVILFVASLLAAQEPSSHPALEVGQAVEGTVREDDPVAETDRLALHSPSVPAKGPTYRLEVREASVCTIELRSLRFDGYLVLRDEAGAVLAEDDDGLLEMHPRIVLELAPGRYLLQACALHGDLGPFELRVVPGRTPAIPVEDRVRLDLEEAQRRATALERELGPDHRAAIRGVYLLGRMRNDYGRFEAALEAYDLALERAERVLGPDDLETARVLDAKGYALLNQGRRAEARPVIERALSIRRGNLPADHGEIADTVSKLGLLLSQGGSYPEALERFEEGLRLRESSLGGDHPRVGESLNNIAATLRRMGRYEEAIPIYRESLEIRERALGPHDPEVGLSLNGLSLALKTTGRAEEALECQERALAIWEEAYGGVHPRVAVALNNLGELHRVQGRSDQARPLLERAVELRERIFGPDHAEVSESLNNLGLTLQAMGLLEEARPLLERSLAIAEDRLGPDHPACATTLNNLAILLKQLGDPEGALPLYRRAIEIQGRRLGPGHPELARSASNLSVLLWARGELDEALDLCRKALDVRERALGGDHPVTAATRYNLAFFPWRGGELDEALDLVREAAGDLERALGRADPRALHARRTEVLLLREAGRPERAWETAIANVPHRGTWLERLLWAQTEHENHVALAAVLGDLETLIALGLELDDAGVHEALCDSLLAWKGRAARLLVLGRAGVDDATVGELRRRRRELARVALDTTGLDRAARIARLEELHREVDRLELAWRRSLDAPANTETTWRELRASLPAGSAAVEFLDRRVLRDERLWEAPWGERRLSAWITRAGVERPVHVDLGPTRVIEQHVRAYVESLAATRGRAVESRESAQAGAALRASLWDPLAAHLEGIETVFVSPDGSLGALPFEVVPLENGDYLIERRAFVYLQDLGWLARAGEGARAVGESLLAVGAVDFQEREPPASSVVAASTPEDRLRGFNDFWGALPSTGYEAQVVHDLHALRFESGTRLVLQGSRATEERLTREMPRHAVLHLATHGFFNPEGLPSAWEEARGGAAVEPSVDLAERALVGARPGLLSGLVLAGANAPPDVGVEDGYLTAEELGWLDLSKVDLVVLSACETGLGRRRSGEGMIGLRRAFRVGGARTVISSLWSVRDESTSELMQAFYENLWVRAMGRLPSLRAAQLEVLARNRARLGSARPLTWGAFVLSGEWR